MKKEDKLSLVFKKNDIRGEFPKEINEDLFYKVGRAFVTYFKSENVIVGYDMRVSSPKLSKAFMKGIIDSGANAIDIGTVSTDVVYFASGILGKSAVMITSSHNPAKNNGIKFLKRGVVSINYTNGLNKIKSLVKKNKFKKSKRKGRLIKKNLLKQFKKHVLSFIDKKNLKGFSVIIDAGNGMAGKTVPLVYKGLPMKITPMYFKLDGRFPNHIPNPLIPENTEMLTKKVKKSKADFGMAFDGDADRMFLMDENGKLINSSHTSCLMIKYFLKRHPGEKIMYNAEMSNIVPETIKRYGGRPLITKVGHSIIKNYMRKKKALFACEHSGHFYFKDNYRADSAVISSLILYEMLSEELGKGRKLSEVIKEFQKYHKSPEKNIKIKSDKEKHDKIKKLESYYKKHKGVKKISTFEGIRVEFDDFWFNVRPSETENYLRIDLEADTKKIMKKELRRLIKRVKKI